MNKQVGVSLRAPARGFVRYGACVAALAVAAFTGSCKTDAEPSSDASAATRDAAVGVAVQALTSVTNSSNFNGTAIPAGRTIWFTSIFKVTGAGSQPVHVHMRASHISFSANGTNYDLPTPDGHVTIDPARTTAVTTFDSATQSWSTLLPSSWSGNAYFTGFAYPVPANLPGGINPVAWSASFDADTPGLSVKWAWSAAVYTTFGTSYNALNVKPVDDNAISAYLNSDHAGTPEAFKTNVVGGARGGGGSNHTGSLSGTLNVAPAPCSPNGGTDATCNGVDDDCDALIDDDFVSSATSCGQGVCVRTGTTSCVNGALQDSCTPGAATGTDANCDAVDQDCDGLSDEAYQATTSSCGIGACVRTGTTSCVTGNVQNNCTPGTPAANDTTCDAIDDDCSGIADEDYISLGTGCGVGACARDGNTSCSGGVIADSCSPGTAAASDTTCDGIDDDCSGSSDEDYAPVSTSCGVGACVRAGSTSCVTGNVQNSCSPGPAAVDDAICNGIDDDCSGAIDEDFAAHATTCGLGVCARVGSASCDAGVAHDTCVPGTPDTSDDALCDGIDDDCDGASDEDYPSEVTHCGEAGCARSGILGCIDGEIRDTCVPGTECESDCANETDDDGDGKIDCEDGDCGRVPSCPQVGSPCTTDEECAGIPGADHLWFYCDSSYPGGYCVRECDQSDPNGVCPQNTFCWNQDVCVQSCDSSNDCSTQGFACEPLPYGPHDPICRPTCEAGCAAEQYCDLHVDLCSSCKDADVRCDGVDENCNGVSDEDFAAGPYNCGHGSCQREGSIACDQGHVVVDCTPGSGCENDCGDHLDDDGDGQIDCADSECAQAPECLIGAGCETDDDCAGLATPNQLGFFCVQGLFPGNYCTRFCDSADPNGPCPSGSECLQNEPICVRSCDGAGGCADPRDVCQDLSFFGIPGPFCRSSCASASCPSGQRCNSQTNLCEGCDSDDTTCDGFDDDCDGIADDDFVAGTSTCGEGGCARTGTLTCIDGQLVDTCTVATECETSCTNGVDDEGDGDADCGDDDCAHTAECLMGAPCTTAEDCVGLGTPDDAAYCLNTFARGYCARPNYMSPCPAGAFSFNEGLCLRSCDANDGCPFEGQHCTTFPEAGYNQPFCATSCDETNCNPDTRCDPATRLCTPCNSLDDSCDGSDDDCDGIADDDVPTSPTVCGIGACATTGEFGCVNGNFQDSCAPAAPTGADDDCDGIDDDCDGGFDEDYVSTATSCGVGVCARAGMRSCVEGSVHDNCQPGTPSGDDTNCNGLDEDCDGRTDEGFTSTPTTCGTGACARTGVTSCIGEAVQNSCAPGSPAANDTVCNGVDDDCDGHVDDDYVSVVTTCGIGACTRVGSRSCTAGTEVNTCVPGSAAGTDGTCNGLDDDCNGQTDEDYVSVASQCGVGACARTGAKSCLNGAEQDSCSPGSPAASDATCNGADDNCNGQTDEGYAIVATSCGVGACVRTGSSSCVNGTVQDSCAPGTPAAGDVTCNNVDDDCDGTRDESYEPVCSGTARSTCTNGQVVFVQCVDSTVCNGQESCMDGACVAGTPLVVADADACTTDSCDPVFGVIHRGASAGTPCSDGNICNGQEACLSKPSCLPSPSGAFAFWPGDGNGNDVIGNSHGIPTSALSFATGQVDQAFSFGLPAYLDLTPNGSVLSNFSTRATLEFWIRVSAVVDGQCGTIFDLRQDGAHAQSLQVGDGCTGALGDELVTWTYVNGVGAVSAAAYTTTNRSQLFDNAFHHLALTLDGTTTRMYLDGVARSVSNGSGTNQGIWGGFPSPFFTAIGMQNLTQARFSGRLDEITLYNRALSATEIANIYAAGTVGKCKRPICISNPNAPPQSFDDGNVCTIDGCTPPATITHVPGPTGTSCSDGVSCHRPGSCNSSGQCAAPAPAATDASCDNFDDDCDGIKDDDYPSSDTFCERNGCSARGAYVCIAGAVVDTCSGSGTCTAEIACADSLDNDGDARTDCADADCANLTLCDETNCGNGLDDNHDGLVDCADPHCFGGPPCIPEICGNSIDDDGDHLADCADADCDDASACAPIPPHANTIAPLLDNSVPTHAIDVVSFLYTGADPIQRGVVAGTITEERAAMLSGRVKLRNEVPLAAVRVEVLGHPEFGLTHTDTLGEFHMAVNGGDTLTVRYSLDGYIPVQRQVATRWQLGGIAEDVVMLPRAVTQTTIDTSGSSSDYQVAIGSAETDDNGTRRGVLVFAPGTQAQVFDAQNSVVNVSSLHMRLTEFTVGLNGPEAMPAPLPPTSAYTYAVDITPDEGEGNKLNGVETLLSQPAIYYLDNFLSIPTGTGVPVGYYDDDNAVWKGMDNGLVIRIVSETGAMADIDTTGDAVAESSAALAGLGITDGERQVLAQLYDPNASLWRVSLAHFSTIDLNFGPLCSGCPSPPDLPKDKHEGPEDPLECNSSDFPNSTVNCFTQVLGEHVPVTGTPFSLHYESDRVPGFAASRSVVLPIRTVDPVAGNLIRATLRTTSALGGQQRFDWAANALPDTFTWTWDGQDEFGRQLNGTFPARFDLAYVYSRAYAVPGRFGENGQPIFASFGDQGQQMRLSSAQRTLEVRDYRALGLGGWSLSPHHQYDTEADEILFGDGTRGKGREVPSTTSVAELPESDIRDFAIAANGTIYAAADAGIYRWLPDGTRSLWKAGSVCTAGLATATLLCAPYTIAIGPDGFVYASDYGNTFNNVLTRVLRLDPATGSVQRIAGSTTGFSGDGGLAIDAHFNNICDLEVAGDGSIYVADCISASVRRIAPDGTISRVAGTGVQLTANDPFTVTADDARTVKLSFGIGDAPGTTGGGIAIDPAGGFFIAEGDFASSSIRHVAVDGRLTTVYRITQVPEGTGFLTGPPFRDVAVDPRGDLVLPTTHWSVYLMNRRTNPPSLEPIAGRNTGNSAQCLDTGAFPLRRRLGSDNLVAVGADGQLYIYENCAAPIGNRILRMRVNPQGEYGTTLASSPDGREVYEFDGDGRHKRTMSALTGQQLLSFEYENSGLLASITDANSNTTTIQRAANGTASAIVAPFGQSTELTYDANRYLATAKPDPDHDAYEFTHDANGLLTQQTDPRGSVHIYQYDPMGRLTRDEDAAGGFQTFNVTHGPGFHTAIKSTALGRTTTYDWRRNDDGHATYTVTFPTGHSNVQQMFEDGSSTTTLVDGTVVTSSVNPDPVFGMDAPLTNQTTRTPGNLSHSVTQSRTATLGTPGNPLTLTSATDTLVDNGRTTTRTYTASTRTETTTTPQNRVSTTVIDTQGRLSSSSTAGTLPFTFDHDARGRIARTAQGIDRFTDFGYDPATGLLSSQTNALSQTTSYVNDAVGRVTSETRADSSAIGFSYDAESHMTSVTPPGRSAHGLSYTPVDLSEDYTAPQIGATPTVTHNAYNLDRQLTSVTQPDGLVQTYTYDPTKGRLTNATIPGTGTYDYNYDNQDRLSSITLSGSGSMTFGYDGQLVTSQIVAGPQTITDNGNTIWTGTIAGSVLLGYSNVHKLQSVDVHGGSGQPNGFAASYTRDNDDLVTSIAPLVSGTGVPAMTLTRSPLDGHLAATSMGVVSTAYSHDISTSTPGHGDLLGISDSVSGSEIYGTNYQRDALGRITRVDETIQGASSTKKYEYDPASRLIRVRDASDALISEYSYDGNGARTSAVTPTQSVQLGPNLGCGALLDQPVDAQDRLCRYGENQYSFNGSGQLASKTSISNGAVTSYTYDGLGRLRTVQLPGSQRIDYVLDVQGRRIGKVVNGSLVKGWLYFDSLRPVAQFDNAGHIEATFVYETRANVPEFIVRSTGQVYRVLTDHLGSVRLVVNTADGSVAQRVDYDEFGNVVLDTNPGFQPLGFAGGIYDADTELVRFGKRDYDALTGRWMGKDPSLFRGGSANLYQYASGDPINRIDVVGTVDSPFDINGRADHDARTSGLPGDWNGPQDAYRHCLASCENRRENGEFVTACLGFLNEKFGDWFHDQDPGEHDMDTFNNSLGIGFGESAQSFGDCRRQCYLATRSGWLITKPNTSSGYVGVTLY